MYQAWDWVTWKDIKVDTYKLTDQEGIESNKMFKELTLKWSNWQLEFELLLPSFLTAFG